MDAVEHADLIICPYCEKQHRANDFIEGEHLADEFIMPCEGCGKEFKVDYYNIFYCTTYKLKKQ